MAESIRDVLDALAADDMDRARRLVSVNMPRLVMLAEVCPKCGAPLMQDWWTGGQTIECMMIRDQMGYGNCDYGRPATPRERADPKGGSDE
jgi:hypothetical protein